jgi:hypothetical protein
MDIFGHWTDVLSIIAYIIAIASVIVKLTPDPKDDTVLAKIVAVLKVLSLYKDPEQK